MPFEITGLTPMLKVPDLTQTMQFYAQTLGFAGENQISDGSGKPTWCALK